ncbi:hypothetical protein [Subtercola lobariae]|nr:hypothetical protein [Subtercola lobariae]
MNITLARPSKEDEPAPDEVRITGPMVVAMVLAGIAMATLVVVDLVQP